MALRDVADARLLVGVAVPLIGAGLAWRAVGEERLLRRELLGYDDDVRPVRFRLIPDIW